RGGRTWKTHHHSKNASIISPRFEAVKFQPPLRTARAPRDAVLCSQEPTKKESNELTGEHPAPTMPCQPLPCIDERTTYGVQKVAGAPWGIRRGCTRDVVARRGPTRHGHSRPSRRGGDRSPDRVQREPDRRS